MRIKEIKFNEVKGQLTIERTREEIGAIAEVFRKSLKLSKYQCYIDIAGEIHFNTKSLSVDITERANNKFIVVKEDAYGKRQFSYYELEV